MLQNHLKHYNNILNSFFSELGKNYLPLQFSRYNFLHKDKDGPLEVLY